MKGIYKFGIVAAIGATSLVAVGQGALQGLDGQSFTLTQAVIDAIAASVKAQLAGDVTTIKNKIDDLADAGGVDLYVGYVDAQNKGTKIGEVTYIGGSPFLKVADSTGGTLPLRIRADKSPWGAAVDGIAFSGFIERDLKVGGYVEPWGAPGQDYRIFNNSSCYEGDSTMGSGVLGMQSNQSYFGLGTGEIDVIVGDYLVGQLQTNAQNPGWQRGNSWDSFSQTYYSTCNSYSGSYYPLLKRRATLPGGLEFTSPGNTGNSSDLGTYRTQRLTGVVR